MTWISELTRHREWSFLKSLTDFTQLGEKRDPISNYPNLYTERKKRLIQGCLKSEQVFTQIGDFQSFVNKHYSYVQGIILYRRWVIENLFRKKETASLLSIPTSSVGSTEIHVKVYQKMPGFCNDVVQ